MSTFRETIEQRSPRPTDVCGTPLCTGSSTEGTLLHGFCCVPTSQPGYHRGLHEFARCTNQLNGAQCVLKTGHFPPPLGLSCYFHRDRVPDPYDCLIHYEVE